jgi:hypothetical protein
MPPPPWTARKPGEKEAMRDWMFYQIEECYREQQEKSLLEPLELRDLIEDEAIAEAERNDLTKLRQLFHPKFHPFLQAPRKRGRRPYARRPNDSSYESRLMMARKLVPLIRKIWQEHYGPLRRRREDGFDAYDIAAAYLDIEDVEAVAQKPSGKRKIKRDK